MVMAVVYPAVDFGSPFPQPSTETRTKGATAIVVDDGSHVGDVTFIFWHSAQVRTWLRTEASMFTQ